MKFKKAKCKVRAIPSTNTGWAENSPEEKDLRVLVDEVQHDLAMEAQKANCVLGYIKSIMASRLREGISTSLLLSCETLLGYDIQLWGSQHKEYKDLLE
ncbi:hypothetical protein TURU_067742 [Turdus rufiventris]|nr:hypothetical protein TURU_067742 [Turdus rufiventris]